MSDRTLLIVESNEKITRKIAEPLQKFGFHVSVVQWAEEALTLIQNGGIDAVLIRSRLPGMNGIDFCKEVRRNKKFQIYPIIMMYGKDEIDLKVQAFKVGIDDYLILPFQIPELLLRLQVRLTKTIRDTDKNKVQMTQDLSLELSLPDSFPPRGSVVSRSLPSLMGVIYQRGWTGVLRLMERSTLRAFFFDNGLLRGARSSKSKEKLIKNLIKWGAVDKTAIKGLRLTSIMMPDRELITSVSKRVKMTDRQLDALACRYQQFIAYQALGMKKADYDWNATDNSESMFLMRSTGIHPAHILLSAYRKMFFPPSYKVFLPKETMWLFPTSHRGKLQDLLRLVGTEDVVLTLLAKGLTVKDFLSTGKQIVPYIEQLTHLLLSFGLITADEKRPVSKKEADSVMPDERPKSEEIDELLKKATGEQEIAIDDIDEIFTKPSRQPAKEAAPKKPKAKSGKVAVPPSGAPSGKGKKSGKDSSGKRSAPAARSKGDVGPQAKTAQGSGQVAAKKSAGKSGGKKRPIRRVRELYPDQSQTESPAQPEKCGVADFGFKKDDILNGDVSKTPVIFLFAIAREFKKTGVLSVKLNQFTTKLFWRRGHLLFARSDDPKLRINQIMIDMGMITQEQKEQVDEMLAEMGKMRSGTLIFRKQMVSMLQLSEAIHHQIDMILSQLFNSTKGTYTFLEGQLPEEDHIPLDLSTEKLLMKNLIGIESIDFLSKYLVKMDDILVHTVIGEQTITQLKLGSVVTRLFDKFRKPAKVEDVIAGMDGTARQHKMTILGLMLLGLINYYKSPM